MSIMERMDEMNKQNSGCSNKNTDSHAGRIIRENQENNRYTSLFEEGTSDWQDRSTGSMGSQRSGGLTSRKMNAEKSDESQKQGERYNRYGQSPEDIQHIKDNEQMIRGGYSETQETDTNPYLRDMYHSSTREQLSGNEESIQQMENQSKTSEQPQARQQQETRTSADRYNNQRVTEEGKDQEIGGPMDASKNY